MFQIRVGLNAANLLLAARTSAAVQRANGDVLGNFALFFVLSFYSVQLQLFHETKVHRFHVLNGLLPLIDRNNTGYFSGSSV